MTTLASRAVKGRMLKERTGELITAVGGLEAAAPFCRVSKTQLARYASLAPADADRFAPIDVIRCLETIAAAPVVTEHMASEAGGVFVTVPAVPDHGDLLRLLGAMSQESNSLTQAICDGLADHVVDAAEARKIMTEALQLAQVAMQMRAVAARFSGEE